MVMKKHITLIGLIVFSLIGPSSNVSANTTDYSPIISFDKTQGMTIESTTSIGGYIEDEEKPTSVWWTLFSESSIIYSDIITEKITGPKRKINNAVIATTVNGYFLIKLNLID